MHNSIPTASVTPSRNPAQPSTTPGWTRHLGAVLATTLIFVSGTAFVSLLEAFH